MKEAGVRWGGDRVHREELLQQNHCHQGMVEASAIGTWEHGLERLLHGWITVAQKMTRQMLESKLFL